VLGAVWAGGRGRRVAIALAALGLVLATERVLERPLRVWNQTAAFSGRMRNDLEREMAGVPAGSLLVVGAPVVGASDRYHVWLWMWSLPFAARPPFIPAWMAERVVLVTPPDVFCCPRDQWIAANRQAVMSWAGRAERPPAAVLRWDAGGGNLDRWTDRDDPELREKLLAVAGATTFRAMCERLDVILGYLTESCEGP
jgi:hypothetical protein